MASEKRVVRLSHKQILDMAANVSNDSSNDADSSNSGKKQDRSKRNKRPEREIYQPAHMRQHGRKSTDSQDEDFTNQARSEPRSPQQSRQHSQKSFQQSRSHSATSPESAHSQYHDHRITSPKPDIRTERVISQMDGLYLQSPDYHEEDLDHQDPTTGGKHQQRKQKRPDLQIYIPKYRQAADSTEFDTKQNYESKDSLKKDIPKDDLFNDQEKKPSSTPPERKNSGKPRGNRSGKNGNIKDQQRGQKAHVHSHEAEDIERYSKPPRYGSGRSPRGASGSGRSNAEHRLMRKSNSLDWDDEPHDRMDSPDQGVVVNHGWGTDVIEEDSIQDGNSDNKKRRHRRERKPSGPKARENHRGSLPKEQIDSPKHPQITTDEKVEKSINRGTFEGLVFTNSKLEGKPDKTDDNMKDSKESRKNDHRHRYGTEEQPGSTEHSQSMEYTLEPDSQCHAMTWDEQVEEAEKLEQEEKERSRIASVIDDRAQKAKTTVGIIVDRREMSTEKERGQASRRPFKRHDSASDRGSETEEQDRLKDRPQGGRQKQTSRQRNSRPTDKPREDMSKKNIQMKVTFSGNSEKREVHITGSKEAEERRMISQSTPRDNHSADAHRTGRGGLIKLPPHTTPSAEPTHLQSNPKMTHPQRHPHPHHHPAHHPQFQTQPPPKHRGGIIHHGGRGRGQGRGNTHRTLYDPNNPTKPTNTSTTKELHFYDPEHQESSPPTHQMGFFPDQYSRNFSPGPGSPHGYYDYAVNPGGGPPPPLPYYGMPHPRLPPPHIMQQMMEQRATHMENRDPFYWGYEVDPAVHMVPANSSKAEGLMREIIPLENQLCNMVARGISQEDSLHKMQTLREEIEKRIEPVILLHPDICNSHNLDQVLWKSVFYHVIEMLRKQLAENPHNDCVKNYLHNILNEGMSFWEVVLKKLEKNYSFCLEDFVDPNTPPPENLSRMTKLALYSAQRAVIFLGDLARYREQVNQTANYGKARNYYLKAQQLAPKNGRPYNQLAILALYTRRKLDAVYYYMRSLAASNPFLTARESLMSLFDEARKRAEVSEKKKLHELALRRQKHLQAQRNRRARKLSSEGHRVEIWVSTDGSTCHDEISHPMDDLDDLMNMPAVELNKKFILSFLNVHGKLFTKIGMETFPEVSSQMLHEFRALLSHSPSPIGNSRLLQLVTINMFAIENAAPKDGSQLEENCRSLHQEQAVQLGLDTFGLLAERATQLLHSHLLSGDCQVLSEDLHCLFPSIKVWADWMTCHADDWNPAPLPRDPQLGPTIDVWKAIGDLCNVLKEVIISHVKLYSQKLEGCDPIVLPEDKMLAGFVPLLSLPQVPVFVHSTVDKDISRDCQRVDKLQTFGEYLCGIEPPLLSYDVHTKQYISIAPVSTISEKGSSDQEDEIAEDVIIETESEEEPELNTSFGSSGDESQIRQLRARKEELETLKAERDRHQQKIRAVLDDTGQEHSRIQLEVHPLQLVPDTNCFIDHLKGIQKLLETKKYTIVVPLVVINELDGLAKGSREGQYDTMEHADMVYTGAQNAIKFLEEQFDGRNSHMRVLTSKGSVMNTIAFRSEETHDEGTNDDLILSCCLHYCQDKARDFMPKDKSEPIKLHREVVLLTDDRNLRLKAHTRNVPVKDIPSFMRWAKIG